MIAQSTIQRVLATAQVEEIIDQYVSLKRRGVNMIGLCPFHDEKTPSFTVSPSKNLYKCFGCGKGGNATSFLMEHEQMSFPEAIRYLANRYNIEIDEDSIEDREQYEEEKKLQDSLYIINEFAGEVFENNLKGNSIAMGYFKERGFLETTLQTFRLGYADNDYKSLTKLAATKGYKDEFLRSLGLTSQRGNDFFVDRVMFPIQNLSGKMIAFAGRILKKNEKAPKYLNSPESDIYHKRKILYGLYQARNSIRKKDNCIIVEGYTDVLSLYQNGVQNVVASSGTSLTSEQIRLIKRFTSNVTILYDGDAAGVKAAMRGLDLVLSQDMNVRLALLPPSEDPDSYIRKLGTTAFEEFLSKEAKDFILFKSEILLDESGNDPIKKAGVLKDIVSSLSNIRDTLKRSLYVKQCSQLFEIQESILVKEVNKRIRASIKKKEQEQLREQMDPGVPLEAYVPDLDNTPPGSGHQQPTEFENQKTSDAYQELDLVRIIITNGKDTFIHPEEETEVTVVEYIHNQVFGILDHFENPLFKEIIVESFEHAEKNGPIDIQYFITHPKAEIRKLALDFLSPPYEFAEWGKVGVTLQTQKMPELNFQKDTMGAINRILIRKLDHVLKQLEVRIKETAHDGENRIFMLKAALKIQEQKMEIMKRQGSIGIRKI